MSSMPLLTLWIMFNWCDIPLFKKPVRASRITLSTKADRVEVTISFALQTVLIDDSDRFEARR